MAKAKKLYMCDFETTTQETDCRVWASCVVDMITGEVIDESNNIDDFIKWMSNQNGISLYFHNLKFDGEFLISRLFQMGFNHVKLDKPNAAIPEKCFSTMIDEMGAFYKISICFRRKGKRVWITNIFDSLKKIPGKAKQIAKDYGLPIAKGKIDYERFRPVGYELSEEEKEYIETDCRIIQQALKFQLDEGMTKMTIAADSLAFYKNMMGRRFEYWFPVLPAELDANIRMAYKGGFTYCNPSIQDVDIGEGIVLDVNSLYPDAMYNNILPYGYPVFFEGEYDPQYKDIYPLYIQQIRCAFELKPGHLPTIQIRNSRSFKETEYLTSSGLKLGGHNELMEVTLTLTSVDLELFKEHYIIHNPQYLSGFMFRAQKGMFKDYIDHWMHIKETSPKGSAQRQIAKLHLNSLYGKFATSTMRWNKVPVMCPDGVVRYYCHYQPKYDADGNIMFSSPSKILYETDEKGKPVEIPPTISEPVYTPVACFITAFARAKTIRSAQAVYDRFLYADTDSLHLRGTELPEGLEIHPTSLGAWDHEKTFDRARFLRAKTYVEEVDGILEVTCAGMPDDVKYYDPDDLSKQAPEEERDMHPTWDNFHPGMTYPGKLLPKRVKGGIVLTPVDFSIQV